MKLLTFLSHATLTSSLAFLLGLAFDVQALPLFGLTISASLLLIASRDYLSSAARFSRWQLSSTHGVSRSKRRKYTLPFAA
ncbi:MAG: hypothetical protein ABIZ81_17935 [Opitutaceae bacterium]